jgi:hypothetical protein
VRQLGVRLGIGLVVALVATGATLGAPAYAQGHRHHHHHHHTAGGGGSPTTPTAPSSICTASPNPALLNLAGNVVLSVSCHGLAFTEAVTVDSLNVRGNCGGTNLPLAVTADGAGNANFNIFGFGCLPGTFGVQLVGFITTTEFPVTFTF